MVLAQIPKYLETSCVQQTTRAAKTSNSYIPYLKVEYMVTERRSE